MEQLFVENYSKADILNEALNQARVEELDINIPKIKSVTMVEGKWAIVTEYIKGETLSDLIKNNPDKREEYFELLDSFYSSGNRIKYRDDNTAEISIF